MRLPQPSATSSPRWIAARMPEGANPQNAAASAVVISSAIVHLLAALEDDGTALLDLDRAEGEDAEG